MREQAYNEDTGPQLSRVILVWSALGVLVLLLSLRTNLVRPVWRGLVVSAAIVEGSARLEQQRAENAALEAELAFLRSEDGRRWAAWRYLGKVPPGWQAGRIVEGEARLPATPTRPQRIQAWLSAAREHSARQLRFAGDVLRAYSGRRALDVAPEGRNMPAGSLSKTGGSGTHGAEPAGGTGG